MVFTKKNKVMKAPKKIYLHPTAKGEVGASWLKFRLTDEDIEYIRKDALIEKVCNLLSRMVWEVTYEDLEGDSVEHYDKTEFIEEIRKYMKGE